MGILESKNLQLKAMTLQSHNQNKLVTVTENQRIQFLISDLQANYLLHLLQNHSVSESIFYCLRSGVPVGFQQFYSLIETLWKLNLIQNPEVQEFLREQFSGDQAPPLYSQIQVTTPPKKINQSSKLTLETLGKLPFFHSLPNHWLEKMFLSATVYSVEAKNFLIRQGVESRDLYLLLEGRASVYKKLGENHQQLLAVLSAPTIFGEGGFFFKQPRSADVVTMTQCQLARFPFLPEYETLFKVQNEKSLYYRFWLLHALNHSELFKNMPFSTLNDIMASGTQKSLSSKEVLFEEFDAGDSFFILIQGQVAVEKRGVLINTLGQGHCFGELALLAAQGRRTATIRATQDCLFHEISKDHFFKLLGQNLFLAKELENIARHRLERDQRREKQRKAS